MTPLASVAEFAAASTAVPLQSIVGQVGESLTERVFLYALFAAFVVSVLLGLFVSVRVLRGYRESGERRLLLFGVGVLCIVFFSKTTNFLLASALGLGTGYAELIATGWRILGALLVVNAIYDTGDPP